MIRPAGCGVVVLLGCMAFASGQPVRKRAERQGIYISPELKISATHSVDAALKEPLPSAYEVTVGEGPNVTKRTLINCLDYLAMNGAHFEAEFARNLANVYFLGTKCDALDWIRGAKPAVRPAFQNFSWRQIRVGQLPPELALNISRESEAEAKAVSQRGGSILDMEPDLRLRVKSANDAELVSEDETIKLTAYAHGDFLGDGNEELLVRWQSAVKGGTYTSAYAFLLRRGKKGLVVVKQRPLD